jgi:hypothetical protein
MKTLGYVLMITAVALACIGGSWFTATNEEPSAFGNFGEVAFLSFTPLLVAGVALVVLGARFKRNREK